MRTECIQYIALNMATYAHGLYMTGVVSSLQTEVTCTVNICEPLDLDE